MARETPAARLRRNREYYLNELRTNSKRGRDRQYHKKPGRAAQVAANRKALQEATGIHPPRAWGEEDDSFLRKCYPKYSILEVALALHRSWGSVSHRVSRLGIRKYHSYIK